MSRRAVGRKQSGGRPFLVSVPGGRKNGEAEPVVRRREFETAHPEVTIVPPATVNGRWRAIIPLARIPREPDGNIVGTYELVHLMDQLEEIYQPSE